MSGKKLIVTLILLFAGSYVWAQRDFRKGLIVTHEHDTIYGSIDYRGDIRNAKICSFREIESDVVTDFTPFDILAYRFTESKLYISKNIGDPDNPKYVFLECLVKGLVNLFYFRNDNHNDCYYVEKDGALLALEMLEQEVIIEGKKKIRRLKPYIGVLKGAFNVWEMNGEIDMAKLEHKSLINLVMYWHKSVGADGVVLEKKIPMMALRIGPVVGGDMSTIKMMDQYRNLSKPEPSTNLSVGVNLNIWMPRISEKIFLQMQAIYTKYYFFDAHETTQRAVDTHIKGNALQMGLSIKYEYPKGRIRPTLAGGAAAAYLPNSSIKEIIYNYSYKGYVTPNKIEADFPIKLMLGFGITPGLHYYLSKKQIIFVQAQYQRYYKRKFLNYSSNVISSFGLSVGIYF
jgi:hypothetical protein